jgi:hypothetical protein
MSVATDIATGSSGNVLRALDAKAPPSFYWLLTLLATIGGFLFGYDTLFQTPGRTAGQAST